MYGDFNKRQVLRSDNLLCALPRLLPSSERGSLHGFELVVKGRRDL